MAYLLLIQHGLSPHRAIGSIGRAKGWHQGVWLDFARIADPLTQLVATVSARDFIQRRPERACNPDLAGQCVAGNAVAQIARIHDAKALLGDALCRCDVDREQQADGSRPHPA